MELISHHQTPNVGELERGASVVVGSLLIWRGLKTGHLSGASLALAGISLIRRGVTGHCPAYRSLGVSTSDQPARNATIPYDTGIRVDKSVTINRPRHEVYNFWRKLENLPQFMEYLDSVEQTSATHSHWVTKGVAGKTLEWDAEIIHEVDGEMIGWKSLPGSSVANTGSVHFEDAPGERGTIVKVALQYNPPGGSVGAYIAKLLGSDPDKQVGEDLKHFKSMLEAGELPTSTGQPSGRTASAMRQDDHEKSEQIHAASEDSFPASDAPAWR